MRTKIFSATKNDFDIDTFCTGGPGGQNQNRKKNGVRITHRDTGISAESRVHKSQDQNRKAAFRKVVERLLIHFKRFGGERERYHSTEVVRTYHEKRNEVKDHRTSLTHPYQRTLDGDLDPFIVASNLLVAQQEEHNPPKVEASGSTPLGETE